MEEEEIKLDTIEAIRAKVKAQIEEKKNADAKGYLQNKINYFMSVGPDVIERFIKMVDNYKSADEVKRNYLSELDREFLHMVTLNIYKVIPLFEGRKLYEDNKHSEEDLVKTLTNLSFKIAMGHSKSYNDLDDLYDDLRTYQDVTMAPFIRQCMEMCAESAIENIQRKRDCVAHEAQCNSTPF